MDGLAECGLVDTVYRVVEQGTPLLGLCVGMQILFSESVEFGRVRGLDILKGQVVRFDPATLDGGKIPHMGWNQLHIKRHAPHLESIPDEAAVYFVHSYYPVPDDAEAIATTTDYGGTEFVSSVWWRNIFATQFHPADLVAEADYGGAVTAIVARDTMVGTQFHPEKSQRLGLRLIANFLRWTP